ncbi:MAG: glycosyltransferase [Phycisphaera sp.]|nr:glycosyltransferase [Phycisphaera sp.]
MDHKTPNPDFCVIVPAYNYGRYLPEALDSVLAQQGVDFEVIVIDDGSTDDTRKVVEGYRDRVGYFRQSNQGPYVACKRGLERTTGKWVVFLDADDRLCPGALAHAQETLAKHPGARMLIGTCVTLYPDGVRHPNDPPILSGDNRDNFVRYITGKLKVSAGGAVLHREVFDRIWSVPEPFYHGYDRVLLGQGFAWYGALGTERPLFELRVHEGRMRDNIASVLGAGTQAVEGLFNPDMLPTWALAYRSWFRADVLIEQARLLYQQKLYAQAAARYREVMATRPRAMMSSRHARRFFLCSLFAMWPGTHPTRSPASDLSAQGER